MNVFWFNKQTYINNLELFFSFSHIQLVEMCPSDGDDENVALPYNESCPSWARSLIGTGEFDVCGEQEHE